MGNTTFKNNFCFTVYKLHLVSLRYICLTELCKIEYSHFYNRETNLNHKTKPNPNPKPNPKTDPNPTLIITSIKIIITIILGRLTDMRKTNWPH